MSGGRNRFGAGLGGRGRAAAVAGAVTALTLTAAGCGESGSYKRSCDASACTVKASGTKLTKRQKMLGAQVRVRDVTADPSGVAVHVEVGGTGARVAAGETAAVGGHRVTVVRAEGGKGTKDDSVELRITRGG